MYIKIKLPLLKQNKLPTLEQVNDFVKKSTKETLSFWSEVFLFHVFGNNSFMSKKEFSLKQRVTGSELNANYKAFTRPILARYNDIACKGLLAHSGASIFSKSGNIRFTVSMRGACYASMHVKKTAIAYKIVSEKYNARKQAEQEKRDEKARQKHNDLQAKLANQPNAKKRAKRLHDEACDAITKKRTKKRTTRQTRTARK